MLSNELIRSEESSAQHLTRLFPAHISDATRSTLIDLCTKTSSNAVEQKQCANNLMSYARDFLLRYPQVAEALFLGQELGGRAKQQRMHDKALQHYTGRDVARGDIWSGAGEHSLSVGMLAEILARRMGLSDAAVARVAIAGGIHDWNKKQEMMHMWDAEDRLADEGITLSSETINNPAVIAAIRAGHDAAKEKDREGLREIGIPDDVIALAGASRLLDTIGPKTDEELIIFFLDHVVSGVRPVDMRKRIRGAVNSNPLLYTAYENSFRDQLGGSTAHELMLGDMGERIQRRIADRIGYTGDPQLFHDYLADLFIDAVCANTSRT